MTDASSLTPIAEGAVADSATLRNNFTYLDNRITNLASTVSSVEKTSNKGQPLGYCGLDANGQIPNSCLSSYNATVTSSLSTINSTLATKASSNNPTLTGTVKVPNNAAVGTAVNTAAISKTATQNTSAYVKFGNGLIIQWMKFTQNKDQQVHSWKIPFTNGNSYATMLTQSRWGQDTNISVSAQAATNFTAIVEDYERGSYLYAIAIGY